MAVRRRRHLHGDQRPGDGTYRAIRGDFDRNGFTDIFWYRPGTLGDGVWLANGDGTFRAIDTEVNGTYQPLAGDFNGDNRTDIVWYAPGGGNDPVWLSNGDGTFRGVEAPVDGTYRPLVGDFTGDRKTDIFWYRPGAGGDSIWISDGDGTFTGVATTVNGTTSRCWATSTATAAPTSSGTGRAPGRPGRRGRLGMAVGRRRHVHGQLVDGERPVRAGRRRLRLSVPSRGRAVADRAVVHVVVDTAVTD